MDTNSIISRILKCPIKIEHYFSFIHHTILSNEENIYRQYDSSEDFPFKKDISYIEVDEHALDRWNSRVGPILSLDQLELLFNQLLLLPGRMEKVARGIGVIDSEIIFTYEKTKGKMLVTTFYGRRSQHPSLNQVETLRRYNGFKNEQVNLDLEEDLVKAQKLPSVPIVYTKFNGRLTKYSLEGYKVEGKRSPIFIVHSQPGNTTVIDTNHKLKLHINKSVLWVLFLMRHRDFVWRYLQDNHKEKVKRLENK